MNDLVEYPVCAGPTLDHPEEAQPAKRSTQENPARLAIVLSHPIQYYSPWFRWMRANTALQFRVFYLSDFGLRATRDEKFEKTFAWDTDLTSGYDWEIVPNEAKRPDTLRYDGLKNPQLLGRLRAWKPHAILLFGYKYHTHLRLIAWVRWRRIPLIFRGDSHLLGRPKLPWKSRGLLRILYAQFAAITYVGRANRDYFRACGVAEADLFFAPHAVDAEHFRPEAGELRAEADRLRTELHGEGRLIILFAGKLIASKQPGELLQAFLAVAFPHSTLVFVGDGPEKNTLEAEARENPLAQVIFLPFANQSEMPSRYAMADLFVLPSRGHYETWGLAVNEAMQLGVPCLVSDRVGAQRDLIDDGETGWVFAAEDAAALKNKLREALTVLSDPAKIGPLRQRIHARISGYTYEQTTAGLLAAFAHALR
jgi:glycosyltransferase involved in cell wall biosynthesis